MSKTIPVTIKCPRCKSPDAAEIYADDNYGMRELLEKHCNQCKWAVGADGTVRNEGRPVNEFGQFLDVAILINKDGLKEVSKNERI